ncbi:MAG: hypothetical protein ACK2UK_06865 [Candidatus Promineifilaceae bacterium]
MSTERNKAVARQFGEEVFNQGNTRTIDELMPANFIEHNFLPSGLPSGHEGVEAMLQRGSSEYPGNCQSPGYG